MLKRHEVIGALLRITALYLDLDSRLSFYVIQCYL